MMMFHLSKVVGVSVFVCVCGGWLGGWGGHPLLLEQSEEITEGKALNVSVPRGTNARKRFFFFFPSFFSDQFRLLC